MVKISDLGAKDAFGLDDIPALVYFENGIPELYEGDLLRRRGPWAASRCRSCKSVEGRRPPLPPSHGDGWHN